MIWHNIGGAKKKSYLFIYMVYNYKNFHVCVPFRVFKILPSIDLMTLEVVFRLVMKYTTSPKVLKWTPKGAPPGATVKSESV